MCDDSPSPRETVMQMIDGYRVAQALHVAATLGIADLLADGPRSIDDLAKATGTDASALFRLLRALAGAGVFAETDDGYCLTPLARYLRSGVPGSVRARAMHIGQPYFWQSLGHLLESVRTGEPAFPSLYGMSPWEYREAHPEANAIFNQAMTELAAGVVDAVVQSYDFSGFDVLVDVGGGEGTLLAAILAAYPRLRGVLFDQPHVVTDARAVFERAGVAARAEVVEGSFSCVALWSWGRSAGSPDAATSGRCSGSGGTVPGTLTWTCSGGRMCAASTKSIPIGFASRRSTGRCPGCGIPSRRTAGPGW